MSIVYCQTGVFLVDLPSLHSTLETLSSLSILRMKRLITLSTSAVLLLSFAMPVFAMRDPGVESRMSRRLLEDKTRADQRIPLGTVQTEILLRERKETMKDVTGRTNLSRSRITTRLRSLRGARLQYPLPMNQRPTRRSVREDAESMLVLPPTLVQTGEEAVSVQKVTRRTLVEMTKDANRLR